MQQLESEDQAILQVGPEQEIVTTRVVAFPRELVYRAWTEPEHLKVWWGPAGFTNTFQEHDLRVGGRWIFTMHGPEKGNYENAVTFAVVRPPELLVWDRQSKPLFQVEARFEEISANETRVIFKQKFESEEECEKIRKYVLDKNEENMDRLEAELTRMV
jgi:uncharacterized protein YndB with AHSA1/START domain